jgi:hypothetical protein
MLLTSAFSRAHLSSSVWESLETAQKLNSLWRGRNYAPLLQQPFSADAISALPKGIKLLQRSADSMQKLAAAVEHCRPNRYCPLAAKVVMQQAFLQDLQQQNPAQLATELLSWLQAWPDLPDALLSDRNACSRVQVAADLLWRGATRMLMHLLQAVYERAAADSGMPNPWLELLKQLIGPCCTTGAPGLLDLLGIMHDVYLPFITYALSSQVVHALEVRRAGLVLLCFTKWRLLCAEVCCAHALHALQALCPHRISCSRICWTNWTQPAAALPARQLPLHRVCRQLCTQPLAS